MTIRVGVIGLNYGARVHIPAYKNNPSYEVVAVCARTPERVEAVAREFDIPKWYTDARQLITSDLDLVSIASPPRTHSGYAAAALAAGKHAVIEIGFVASALDARVLVDMSKELGRIGAPAFVLRYTPLLRMISDLLAGEHSPIGRPRLMRFELLSNFLAQPNQSYRWMWDANNGGGVLTGFVAHGLDLARRWFGPVKEVDGALETLADIAIAENAGPLADDTGFVTLRFENGMLATFTHSAVAAYSRTSIELHGAEGSLLIEGFGDEAALLPMGAQTAQPLYPPEQYLEETRGYSGVMGGFDIFLDRLAVGVTNGVPPADLPNLNDGLEVTRIIDAVKLASRQRRRVRLEEIK